MINSPLEHIEAAALDWHRLKVPSWRQACWSASRKTTKFLPPWLKWPNGGTMRMSAESGKPSLATKPLSRRRLGLPIIGWQESNISQIGPGRVECCHRAGCRSLFAGCTHTGQHMIEYPKIGRIPENRKIRLAAPACSGSQAFSLFSDPPFFWRYHQHSCNRYSAPLAWLLGRTALRSAITSAGSD